MGETWKAIICMALFLLEKKSSYTPNSLTGELLEAWGVCGLCPLRGARAHSRQRGDIYKMGLEHLVMPESKEGEKRKKRKKKVGGGVQ